MRVINRTTLSIYRWLPLIFCILWGGCKANSGPTAPTGETLNSVPVILTPLNGAQVGSRPEFRVQNVSGGGGARTYQFEISESPLFLSSISDAVSENSSGTTVYQTETALLSSTTYYWRVRVVQAGEVGPFTETSSFTTSSDSSPVIVSLAAASNRAEVNVPLQLSAVVEDETTLVENLIFEWTADAGTFSGAGPTVFWTGGLSEITPASYDLTLTVIENIEIRNSAGTIEVHENRTSESITIYLNESVGEVTTLVDTFLEDFSNSDMPAVVVVRNFSDNCSGKAAELSDVENNRLYYEVVSATFEVTDVWVNSDRTYAIATAPCEFNSIFISTGETEIATGVCTITAVYEPSNSERPYEWWLCDSQFDGSVVRLGSGSSPNKQLDYLPFKSHP